MKNKKKIYKESISTLLERYFNGETTLHEEETLRNYFSGAKIDPDFKQYTPLFNYFSQEKKKMNFPTKIVKHILNKKMFFRSFSLSAAAALAIFAFIHWPDQQKGVEMMIGGERINNEQIVISKTDEQLAKISNMMGMIRQSTSSLKKLNNVEKSLSIISKK